MIGKKLGLSASWLLYGEGEPLDQPADPPGTMVMQIPTAHIKAQALPPQAMAQASVDSTMEIMIEANERMMASFLEAQQKQNEYLSHLTDVVRDLKLENLGEATPPGGGARGKKKVA